MPKLKTHSGAKKRFKVKKTGVKFRRTNRNHILTKKANKRMRRLRTNGLHLCDAHVKLHSSWLNVLKLRKQSVKTQRSHNHVTREERGCIPS